MDDFGSPTLSTSFREIIPQETTTENECSICSKSFSMIHLKHRCNKCLHAVCNKCSKHKWKLPKEKHTKRVCDTCYAELSQPSDKRRFSSYHEMANKYHTFQLKESELLTDPTNNTPVVLLSAFNNWWLRNKYPQYYQRKLCQLFEHAVQKHKDKEKKKRQKPRMLQKKSPPIGRGYDFETNPFKKDANYEIKPTKTACRNPVIVLQAGTLWINIMNAVGIPKCDKVGKPDPYCVYYVQSNDPFTKYKTKILRGTFHPEWNEERTIILTNTTGKLVIELWDWDRASSDDFLGQLAIPINSLFVHYSCSTMRSKIIDDWFEISIVDKYKKDIHNDLSLVDNLHSNGSHPPIYKQLDAIPNIEPNKLRNATCCVRIQLQLTSTWHANLISHFDPVVEPLPQTVFDLNKTMHEVNKFLLYLFPIMDQSNEAIEILKWIQYQWSIVYVVLFTVFIFYPWWTLFYIELRLLIYICHSYVMLDNKRKAAIRISTIGHWICIIFGSIPLLCSRIIAQQRRLQQSEDKYDDHRVFDVDAIKKQMENIDGDLEDDENELNQDEDPQEEEISLGAFTKIMGKKAIKVSGMKPTLGFVQDLLVMMNEAVEYIKDVCKWKDEHLHIVKMMVIGLCALCFLSIVLRETSFFKYQLYVIGMCALTFYSKPIQFLLFMILGASYWYNDFYLNYKKYHVANINNKDAPSGCDEFDLLKASTINERIMADLHKIKGAAQNKTKMDYLSYCMDIALKIKNWIVALVVKIFEKKQKIE